jgi:hypothetical protein
MLRRRPSSRGEIAAAATLKTLVGADGRAVARERSDPSAGAARAVRFRDAGPEGLACRQVIYLGPGRLPVAASLGSCGRSIVAVGAFALKNGRAQSLSDHFVDAVVG